MAINSQKLKGGFTLQQLYHSEDHISLKDLFLKFKTYDQLNEVKIFSTSKSTLVFFNQDEYVYGSFSMEELISAILDNTEDTKALQLDLNQFPYILKREAI